MAKKALCCGLNYPKAGEKGAWRYQLYGCINDCLDWEHLLRHTFGFDETRVLIDQNPDGSLAQHESQIPTKANILAQVGWLCSDAEPGDCLVFVFAGHGTQVRCGNGTTDEALVPEDFDAPDAQGNPRLVFDDEMHALFQRLPAGVMLTVILDCCHGGHMLDVPCSVDTSAKPPKTVQYSDRPQEVLNRTEEVWQKCRTGLDYARARPRFIPTMQCPAGRPRRTQAGTGSHVGRMTLDPGVSAFCFAAGRTSELALDANIKQHQRGVMSFCLQEALAQLRNRCTYEQLLDRAAVKMDDIREKYLPGMDQHIQLSFCPNSAPSEAVAFDERYATVAQHKLSQRAQMADRGSSVDGFRTSGQPNPAVREVSTDFVPSPIYNPPGPAAGAAQGSGPPHARLYLVIHAAYSLINKDTGLFGDVSDPYVICKVGRTEFRTPTVNDCLEPVWDKDNHFTFDVDAGHDRLELEVMNANVLRDDSLGRTFLDLRSLPKAEWHRLRQRLQDGGDAEIEFDCRLEPLPGHHAQPQSQQQQQQQQQEPQPRQQPAPLATSRQQSYQPPVTHPSRRPPSPERQEYYAEQRPLSPTGGPPPISPTGGMRRGAPPPLDGRLTDGFGFGAGMPGLALASAPPPLQPPAPMPLDFFGMDLSRPLSPVGAAPPLSPMGQNMFGTPNLFGQMPNLMDNLLGGAAPAPGPAASLVPAPSHQPAASLVPPMLASQPSAMGAMGSGAPAATPSWMPPAPMQNTPGRAVSSALPNLGAYSAAPVAATVAATAVPAAYGASNLSGSTMGFATGGADVGGGACVGYAGYAAAPAFAQQDGGYVAAPVYAQQDGGYVAAPVYTQQAATPVTYTTSATPSYTAGATPAVSTYATATPTVYSYPAATSSYAGYPTAAAAGTASSYVAASTTAPRVVSSSAMPYSSPVPIYR